MYINKFNQETDIRKILDFINHHNFGTLITTPQGIPQATHLPFSLENEGDTWQLTAYGQS
jgi:transcriptional regulator